MSSKDEEELDWGEEDYRQAVLGNGDPDADAVDMVSLGDEEDIQHPHFAVEYEAEVSAREETPPPTQNAANFPNRNLSENGAPVQVSALGLSHLPAKPHTIMHGGRSRETIKAAAMSRPPRSSSPPGFAAHDLPANWEIRRSELTIYYYHTVLGASQLKKPTREDAKLDNANSWPGEKPPSVDLYRSLSARNAPPNRGTWPENTGSARNQKPVRTASPPPPAQRTSPPRRHTPQDETRRGRSETKQPNARPRSISPASMLIPRRGQSPARGLAKNGNDARNDFVARFEGMRTEASQPSRREVWDRRADREIGVAHMPDHYSPEPDTTDHSVRDNRNIRSNENIQPPRAMGSRRGRPFEGAQISRGMDHYSPPPEDGSAQPKHGMRRQSVSPPHRGGMRSDAIVFDQYASRRSVSPRPHGSGGKFDRTHGERASFGSRARPDLARARSDIDIAKGRELARNNRFERFDEPIQRHEREFEDFREEMPRESDIRRSPGRHAPLDLGSRRALDPVSLAPRDVEVFPRPEVEMQYASVHPSRLERFPDLTRASHSPHLGPMHPFAQGVLINSSHFSPPPHHTDVPASHHDFEPRSFSHSERPPHHQHDRSPIRHEHRRPPHGNKYNSPTGEIVIPDASRRGARETEPRGRHQDQDRAWDRRAEIATSPTDQTRFEGRRHDNNGRKTWRASRTYPAEDQPTYQDERPASRYEEPLPPDDKQSYPPQDRGWAPRQSQTPLQPKMEAELEPSRPESRSRWAQFQPREPEGRRWGHRSRGGPEAEQIVSPNVSDEETRKRRRVDAGVELVNAPKGPDHELPHKTPVQRPNPKSPVNSFASQASPTVSSVDLEAARARAKDVAAQLGRAGPGSARPKSRFGAAGVENSGATSITPRSLPGDKKETAEVHVEPKSNARPNLPSRKSGESDELSNIQLVNRLVGSSIGGANRNTQFNSGQQNRWKPHNGSRNKASDSWRPEDEDLVQNVGHVPIPRERAALGHKAQSLEGLPARPAASSTSTPGGGRRFSGPRLQRPGSHTHSGPQGDRVGHDADLGKPTPEARPETHNRTNDFSILAASSAATAPRKHSLLDRMTEPKGDRSLMARISASDQGRPRSTKPRSKK